MEQAEPFHLKNDHPRRPYSAWESNVNGIYSLSGMYSVRDSRQVYGHRFSVDKSNNDWLWTVAGFVVAVVIVAAFLAKLS